MFIQVTSSAVFDGKYIKQLSMRQLMDVTESMKNTAGYSQAAELIYLSYFNDSSCTVRLFGSADDVVNSLPPSVFNSAVNEVMAYNGIAEGAGVETENPT